MASKDLKPKQRLGRSHPQRVKIITWAIGLLACGGGLFAAYRYTGTTEVEVAVARVRRGDFIISVRTRGDIKIDAPVIVRGGPPRDATNQSDASDCPLHVAKYSRGIVCPPAHAADG